MQLRQKTTPKQRRNNRDEEEERERKSDPSSFLIFPPRAGGKSAFLPNSGPREPSDWLEEVPGADAIGGAISLKSVRSEE